MIQLAVLGITLAFAVIGGLVTGYIIHIDWIFNILKDHELFEDHEFFAGIPTPEPIEDETPTSFNVNNENPLGSIKKVSGLRLVTFLCQGRLKSLPENT